MKQLYFYKMHGLGNDFVIFDLRESEISFSDEQIHKICNRKIGIGCDQLILIHGSDIADIKMEIINQDGSKALACGNASRCLVRLMNKNELTIEVGDRILKGMMLPNHKFLINMGKASFYQKRIHDYDIGIVDVGNLHAIVNEVMSEAKQDVLKNEIRKEYAQINISFIEKIKDSGVWIHTDENGVGPTDACGSAACATGFYMYSKKLLEREKKLTVHMKRGELEVTIINNEVVMVGDATLAFEGKMVL
jgi:diaminopimelate epimerase